MVKRKSSDPASPPTVASATTHLTKLFAKSNRGLLLDIFIFVANLFLLHLLTRLFMDLFRQVSAENPLAKLVLGTTFLGMWILPALGAVLKRWHFHQRLKAEGRTFDSEGSLLSGCLFSPLFYFCLNLVITSLILTSLGEFLFGKALLKNGALFVTLVIAGLLSRSFKPISSLVTSLRQRNRRA